MIYCKRCLYPDTKPDLTFDENGICSACTAFEQRENIDWEERRKKFAEEVEDLIYRTKPRYDYDCIIPVSGGKDSHYQVIKALEYGLNPLAITATTDDLSDIGAKNLANITKLGVDHIHITTDYRVRRRINRYTLETIGDISWAEHVTIFSIPIREAITRKIPLIIWGENPQNEYGGPNDKANHAMIMERGWLNEFGGLNGLRVQDIIDAGIATEQQMLQYKFPVSFDKKLDFFPINMYLGQYFPWDGWDNAITATEYGFLQTTEPVELNGTYYENLDNYQTGIHDRFKYLKFGFGRATDIACNHIRRNRMTREEGIEFVKEWDGNFPYYYLGKSLSEILEPLDMNEKEYLVIEDKFANRDLFDLDCSPVRQKFKIC